MSQKERQSANKRICPFKALLPFRKGQSLFWIYMLKEEQEKSSNVRNLWKHYSCNRNKIST